jgi:trimethylamine---corrinoid protein Co-methyltransferase
MLKGFVRKFKPLEVLSEEQVSLIHQGAMTVLQETGIKVLNKKALKLLSQNDCVVDFDKKLVKMPASLIEECLRKAPSSFYVRSRESKHDVVIGGDRLYFRLFAGMNSVDLETWEPSTPTKQDLYDYMIIVDALPNLHMVGCYPYFGFKGLDENMKIPEEIAAKIRNTSKIPLQCFTGGSHFYTAKMMSVVNSEAIGVCHCAAPLTYYEDSIDAMFTWIDSGFPVYICSGSVAGGSSPATIAGSSVSNNAELIAGVVMAQLKKPGSRTMVGNFVFPQNMVNGSPLFGDICAALHAAAFNQVWRSFKIPTAVSTTGLTSSKIMDYQCGYEKSMLALISALSGASIIDFHGGLSGELTAHPIQAILDDDVAGMIGRFIEGIEVNDETIATDLIKEVGPIPGHFLSKEHTRKWWKKEQYSTSVADRLTYPEWIKSGKKTAIDYAKVKYDEILKTHKPDPLTDKQDKEIEDILEEIRQHYKGKKTF